MKQRLNYVEELTREHQIAREDFQQKFQIEQNDLGDLRQRLTNDLNRLTIENQDEIEVSSNTKMNRQVLFFFESPIYSMPIASDQFSFDFLPTNICTLISTTTRLIKIVCFDAGSFVSPMLAALLFSLSLSDFRSFNTPDGSSLMQPTNRM